MRKHGLFFYIGLLIAFLAVISIFIFIYSLKLRDVLKEDILFAIHETAQHDKRAIETSIDFFLDELEGIARRMEAAGSKTVQEMQTRLALENDTTSFSQLYVLGRDGRLYTDKLETHEQGSRKQPAHTNLGQLFNDSHTNAVVERCEGTSDIPGLASEALIYGIRLKNFTIGKERMEALFGVSDINFLQDHLVIDNFIINGEAHGYSALIDSQGNFIAGRNRGTYLKDGHNFFDTIANGTINISLNEIREKMQLDEAFSVNYAGSHGDRLIYLEPFRNAGDVRLDWYLIVSVSDSVLEARQMRLSLMALSLLGIAMVSLSGLLAYIMLTRQRLYKANESVKIRSEFLSNMSHEIRTPLTGIIGLNYLLSSHIEEQDRLPQLKLWLAKSKNLAGYLLALINDILDVSTLQSGKIDIKESPISLNAMLDDVCFMQSGNAETGRVNIVLEKDLIHPWIYGDEVRIKQILTNILGNAVKFTPVGGIVTLSVKQRILADGRIETVFNCSDTGKGMSAEFLKHIFDPFVQENRATSDLALRGTGLGMTISHELALALGGDIDVKSTLGKGSVFSVRIPGRPAEPQAQEEEIDIRKARQARMEAASDGASFRPLKVLLVEDAEFNAEFLMELLQEEGFEAVHAENGKVALEIFEQSAPFEFDVILMDMQMPVMDGCEASTAIRKLDRPDAASVWIYACTANTFRQDMDRAMASGMNDFLTKPIDIKVFLQKMNSRERLKHAAASQVGTQTTV